MEGHGEDFQDAIEKIVEDLISVCKNLNEKKSGCSEEYFDDLASKYSNGSYMVYLCGEIELK